MKNNGSLPDDASTSIVITYYTDPLCCWSWGFVPEISALKEALGSRATWHICMGGLLPSWNNFHDLENSVTRPLQMGPVWMQVGQLCNRPIHHQIWMQDPPASSYPACIAVKCAQMQSNYLGERYLALAQEACMFHGKNIAKKEVLIEVATLLHKEDTDFNVEAFASDLGSDAAIALFRKDVQQVQYYRIQRFPSLVIQHAGKSIVISGYRSHAEILAQIDALAASSLPK